MTPRPMTVIERALSYASSVDRYIPTNGYTMATQRLVERGFLAKHLAGGYVLTADGARELAKMRARRTAA